MTGRSGLTGRGPLLLAAFALVVTACSGPILANPAPTPRPLASATSTPAETDDPVASVFPRDDAPHDRLTEWWYDTGHLTTADGRTFGFELVVFRAERGAFPVSWASHLAITDESGERFLYDQRSEVGPQVDRSVPGEGFDLAISGDVLPGVRDTVEPWRMSGMLTHHELEARGEAGPDGTPIGLRLSLEDPVAEPLLHGEERLDRLRPGRELVLPFAPSHGRDGRDRGGWRGVRGRRHRLVRPPVG